MIMTKNAVGNLIARYKTVLQNCSLMNAFGSLAAAVVLSGTVVLGGASGALAASRVDTLTVDTTYEDVTFQDYVTYGHGGVLLNSATLTLNGTIFDNNKVVSTSYYGGVICNVSVLNIDGATFTNNSSELWGGAIFNQASGTESFISNSLFSNNTALNSSTVSAQKGRGGAIFVDKGNITIENTTFDDNHAYYAGGAITSNTNRSNVVTLIDCTFTKNTAGDNDTNAGGGAIAIYSDSTISGTLFEENETSGYGGAVFAGGWARIDLSDSVFTGNIANLGGAIATTPGGVEGAQSLEISSSTFTDNYATTSGGAIYNTFSLGSTNTTITDCTFTNNIAGENGGAIHNAYYNDNGRGTIDFYGTNIFSGNTAAGALNDIYNENIINVYDSLTLDGGITGNGTTNFMEGSTLTVGTATVIAQDTVNVEAGASLSMTKAGTIEISNVTFDSVSSEASAWGWDGTACDASLDTLDIGLLKADVFTYTDGVYTLTTVVDSGAIAEALGSSSSSESADFVASALTNASEETAALITKVATGEKGGEVLESMAQGATVAAVVPGLSNVNAAATTNMGTRTSIVPQSKATASSETSNWLAMNGDGAILPTADGGNMAHGFGIWFMPMYGHTSADGFSTGEGNYGYDTDIMGATLGADYTFASDLRLGLAFNVGQGSSTSTGVTSGENDFDYYGVSVYGAKHFDQFGLSFDMGYTVSENETMQEVSGDTLLGNIDAALFTIGVKAEYLVPLDGFNVTPYAGLRFNYYDVDAYDTTHASGTVAFRNESSDSSVWEIPVGVTFDTTTQVGSWDFTPSLALGVKFAAGDLDAEQSVNFGSDSETIVFASEVADEVTFQGGIGLGFAKDVCNVSLNYTLDLSENVESHGVSVNLRYEF
ncbi:MAG: autotransporter domain-containing protein [Pseudomonadota bacterium]